MDPKKVATPRFTYPDGTLFLEKGEEGKEYAERGFEAMAYVYTLITYILRDKTQNLSAALEEVKTGIFKQNGGLESILLVPETGMRLREDFGQDANHVLGAYFNPMVEANLIAKGYAARAQGFQEGYILRDVKEWMTINDYTQLCKIEDVQEIRLTPFSR